MKFAIWLAALTEDTTPDTTADFIPTYDASATASKKVKLSTLVSQSTIPIDGWQPAAQTWTYESSDAPSYLFSEPIDATAKYSIGMRIKCTQSAAIKFGIITAVGAYSGGKTIITVYMGTDYTLGATITNPYYSIVKAPFGFPLDPAKWTVRVADTSDRTQASPTATTWYNLGSLSISLPIGAWNVSYQVLPQAATTNTSCYVALSTTNNGASDTELKAFMFNLTNICRQKFITTAAKISYYLNCMVAVSGYTGIDFRGDLVPTIIQAVCAYL